MLGKNRTDYYELAKKQAILDLMKDIPIETLQIALVYAKNYKEYGVDVTRTWGTAVEQANALEIAYHKGYCEGLRKWEESEDEE